MLLPLQWESKYFLRRIKCQKCTQFDILALAWALAAVEHTTEKPSAGSNWGFVAAPSWISPHCEGSLLHQSSLPCARECSALKNSMGALPTWSWQGALAVGLGLCFLAWACNRGCTQLGQSPHRRIASYRQSSERHARREKIRNRKFPIICQFWQYKQHTSRVVAALAMGARCCLRLCSSSYSTCSTACKG